MWGISIHSLRMEGDGAITTPGYVGDISIHSLRMEGDSRHCACGRSQLHFNPLPPHGGRRILRSNTTDKKTHFNPLPPHGGRRRKTCYEVFADLRFQSTPSAWRETGWGADMAAEKQFISIHSLRMEGDQRLGKSPEPRNISIHSLRMEGDNRRQQPQAKASHFNPLPPHGGRLLPD